MSELNLSELLRSNEALKPIRRLLDDIDEAVKQINASYQGVSEKQVQLAELSRNYQEFADKKAKETAQFNEQREAMERELSALRQRVGTERSKANDEVVQLAEGSAKARADHQKEMEELGKEKRAKIAEYDAAIEERIRRLNKLDQAVRRVESVNAEVQAAKEAAGG